MPSKPRIAVFIQGGVVQCIYSTDRDIAVHVIDADDPSIYLCTPDMPGMTDEEYDAMLAEDSENLGVALKTIEFYAE